MKHLAYIILGFLVTYFLLSHVCRATTITEHITITSNFATRSTAHFLPKGGSKETTASGGLKSRKRIIPVGSIEERIAAATRIAFGEEQVEAMLWIIQHESGFKVDAWNTASGAGGLFQALPFSKTGCELLDEECQIKWGMSYVLNRYKTPTNAKAFWLAHNWY